MCDEKTLNDIGMQYNTDKASQISGRYPNSPENEILFFNAILLKVIVNLVKCLINFFLYNKIKSYNELGVCYGITKWKRNF